MACQMTAKSTGAVADGAKSSSKVSAQHRARQLKKILFTILFVLVGGGVTVLVALRMGSEQ